MHSDHERDLDPEYLYPADVRVVDIYDDGGDVHLVVAVPCPECDEPLELDAVVDRVEESDLALPLDDAADVYD